MLSLTFPKPVVFTIVRLRAAGVGKPGLLQRTGLRTRQLLETSSSLTSVIVADDDPMIRSVLRSKLEALDVAVFLASDGLEAVELASRIQANLILLDLRMPRLDGLLACRRIRQLPGHAQTPIVVLTSAVGNDAKSAAARVGATTFLTKPFRSAELLQVLSRFLPMDPAKRDEIRRDADLAGRVSHTATALAVGQTLAKAGDSGVLDRGKTILGVLRR